MTFIPGREDEENDERKRSRRLSRGANSAQLPNSSFGSGKGRTAVTLRVLVPFFTLTVEKGRPNYTLAWPGRESPHSATPEVDRTSKGRGRDFKEQR